MKKHHYLTFLLILALSLGCFCLTSAAVPVQYGIHQVFTEENDDADTPGDESDGSEPSGTENSVSENTDPESSDTEAAPSEEPSTETPSTAEPSTEAPSTEEPSTEVPSTAEPSTEAPSTAEPSTEAPSTAEPSTEAPSTEPPSTAAAIYTVTVSAKDSAHISVSGSGNYTAGDTATVRYANLATGYQFDGWQVSGTIVSKDQNYSFKVKQNVTVTAVTSPISYTITYNDADGSGNITSYTIESDSFQLSAPTRDGYVFDGWTGTGLSRTTKTVTIPQGSTGNRSYTAHWSEETSTTEAPTTTTSASTSKVNLNVDLGDAPEETSSADEELEMESSMAPITLPAIETEAEESSSTDEAALFTTTTESDTTVSPMLIVVIVAIILVIIGIIVTAFYLIRNGAFGAMGRKDNDDENNPDGDAENDDYDYEDDDYDGDDYEDDDYEDDDYEDDDYEDDDFADNDDLEGDDPDMDDLSDELDDFDDLDEFDDFKEPKRSGKKLPWKRK